MTYEELREKVAEALYDVPVFGCSYAGSPGWKDESPEVREHYLNEADAALEIIRPAILDEAAKASHKAWILGDRNPKFVIEVLKERKYGE